MGELREDEEQKATDAPSAAAQQTGPKKLQKLKTSSGLPSPPLLSRSLSRTFQSGHQRLVSAPMRSDSFVEQVEVTETVFQDKIFKLKRVGSSVSVTVEGVSVKSPSFARPSKISPLSNMSFRSRPGEGLERSLSRSMSITQASSQGVTMSKSILGGPFAKNHLEAPAFQGRTFSSVRLSSKTMVSQDPDQIRELETIWLDVFQKIQDDNEVHVDDLPKALELAGFQIADAQWVDEVRRPITSYHRLGAEEFIMFLHGWRKKHAKALEKAFKDCDADGSNSIEASELAELLRGFGIEPLEAILEEIIREVDQDNSGSLDLNEFIEVMDILQRREGFTVTEYQEFLAVFKFFEKGAGDRAVETKDLDRILSLLGYAAVDTVLSSIVKQVDVRGLGRLREREFMMVLARIRDHTIKVVLKHTEIGASRNSGGVIVASNILKELGSPVICDEVLEQVLDELGFTHDQVLDANDIWRCLILLRKREGLTNKDLESVTNYFEDLRKDDGLITAPEVRRLLRTMGHLLHFDPLQHLIAKVDLSRTGRLTQQTVLKLLRFIEAKTLTEATEVFMARVPQDGPHLLKPGEVMQAMGELPHTFPLGLQAKFLVEHKVTLNPAITLQEFVQVVLKLKRFWREDVITGGGSDDPEWRGFALVEIEGLKARFDSFDKDHTGSLSKGELLLLTESIFQDLGSDRNLRPRLQSLLREADKNQDGYLDFNEFLYLTNKFHTLQDVRRLAKEQETIQETGFTYQEVAEFRDLFLASCGGDDGVSFNEVKYMMNLITPLGDLLLFDLEQHFRNAIGFHKTTLDEDLQQADFPEFLKLMKILLDCNFAKIKEATSRSVTSPQPPPSR